MTDFKSIAEAELTPERLTVIAGTNSSGKSSLLQAVLLFAQSFGENQVVVNGDLVRLGKPQDVIRNGATSISVNVAEPVGEEDEGAEREELSIVLKANTDGSAFVPSAISLWHGNMRSIHAERIEGSSNIPRLEDETVLRITEAERFGLPNETYLVLAGLTPLRVVHRYDHSAITAAFSKIVSHPASREYFVPELLRYRRLSDVAPDVFTQIRAILETGERRNEPVPHDWYDPLYSIYEQMEAPGGWVSYDLATSRPSRYIWDGVLDVTEQGAAFANLVRPLARAADHAEDFAASVLYLGPLRDDPRVAYPLGHTVAALPVGEKGEFTAAYLQANQRERFSFVDPGGQRRQDTMRVAASEWSSYLGIADSVSVRNQGKLGHQLDLKVAGQTRDPTAIGVGASQLLPVIVLVLGAPAGSVVMLEQPELHLHPKVQSRLADFFLRARPEIRVVIETHSEYLLTRLRLRVARKELDPADLSVLFASRRNPAEHPEHPSPHTAFRRLNIDEMGQFDYWPEEFFDSLEGDSVGIAEAVIQRLKEAR